MNVNAKVHQWKWSSAAAALTAIIGAWPFVAYSQPPTALAAEASQLLPEKLLPVPGATAKDASYSKLRDIFHDRISAAKDAESKSALANDLMGHARETALPADKYALFELAVSLRAEAGDVETAFDAVDEMSALFAFDAQQAKRVVAIDIAKRSPPSNLGPVISRLINIARGDLDEGRLKEANETAAQAAVAARRLKNKESIEAAAQVLAEIRATEKVAAKETKLREAARADDASPKAYQELGEFLCFLKDDWTQGLPWLAKGDDAALKRLALGEMKQSLSPADHLALAEAWAAFAETARADAKGGAKARARHHYTEILPVVRGLEKAKVEKNLAELSLDLDRNSRWLVIFRSADPAIWNTDHKKDRRQFAMPLTMVPKGIRYLRMKNPQGSQVIVPVTADQLAADVTIGRYGWQGTKNAFHGGVLLGIYDQQSNIDNQRGKVCIRHDAAASALRTGWGFGTAVHESTTKTCWQGNPTGNEVVEISVTAQDLTPADARFLLK
jgi:hypothetical protein